MPPSGSTMTALRQSSGMPKGPDRDSIVDTWDYLANGITKIMTDLENGMTMDEYMGVYTAVHNFCTSQKAHPLVAGSPVTHVGTGQHRGAHLLGEDLYKKLLQYLEDHLQVLLERAKQHTDEALLAYYIKEWERFTNSGKYVHHLFRYLNRHWVKREMDEGKKSIYDVYTMHLVQWRGVLFEKIDKQVMQAVLKLVERQRNGETIEHGQIKQVVESFVALGLDPTDATKTTLDCYRWHFEKPFLEATKAFYQAESKEFLAENSIVEYMKKAVLRLDEEEERVKLYLHPDVAIPLKNTCNDALIKEHQNLLRDEFQILLETDREDDMARMYDLLARIPSGLDPLRNRFETHVRKAGLLAVQKVSEDAEKLEPKVYVDALLDIHSQYQGLVKRAFHDEPEFTRSLDNACREFVNRNAMCKSGSNKSPELLAKYADVLLRKSGTGVEEAQLEDTLSQIMTVFKYIEDKDVFQKFYSRMLARRLVHNNSSSDDAETSMISKLKEACGFEYTNKLQRMFQDMQISKDLNNGFKDHTNGLDDPSLLDSTYNILGTGFWPLNAPTSEFNPPAEIDADKDRFTRFYKHKHEGRKLTWLWQLCKGEVKANYCKNSKTPYTLQVSVYQMAILLLFNESDKHTYEDIAEATKMNRETLDGPLSILVKAKIFNVSPEGQKPGPGATFSLNYSFKSKKIRINLNLGTKTETKQEEVETNKTIEEDRKLLLQSAIVRVMKARKKLKHQQLVGETIAQIRSRFVPKVADIKKCIEILLDKEYLERLDDDELGYLA